MTKSSEISFKFVRSASVLAAALLCLASVSANAQVADDDEQVTALFRAYLQQNPSWHYTNFANLSNLIQMLQGRAGPRASQASSGQTGLAGAAGDSRWTGWAALNTNSFAYTFQPLRSTGNSNNVTAGVDYALGNGSLVGVALSSDSSRTSTGFNNGSIDTSGYSIAPYFSMPIGANWNFDASLGFGGGQMKSNLGTGISGETTDKRTFGALSLTYATSLGSWQVHSTGSLMASASDMKQFRLSNAAIVAGSTSSVSQLRIGSRAYYGSGQFVPFLGLTYSQDLNSPSTVLLAGQQPANARGAFIAQLGVGINQGKQVSGSVQLTSEIRNQVRNNGVLGSLSLKF